MPSTNVEVTATGTVPSSVLVGTGFPEVGGHHVQRCIPHGQTKTNVPDHGSDQIAVVTFPGTGVSRSIGLPVQCRGDGDHALLPR